MTNNKDQQPSLEILLLSLISGVWKLNWVTKYFNLKILFSHMLRQTKQE